MPFVTAALCKQVAAEIDTAVDQILTKHGLQKSKRNARYGDIFKYSVEAAPLIAGDNGVNLGSEEAQAFVAFGRSLGFTDPASALGKTFTSGGIEYVFEGYRSRAPKRPVLARRVSDGRSFIFGREALRRLPGYDVGLDPNVVRTQTGVPYV
jgi:hypothetical protein